jgi:RNA polymerase sigma factor (sigma-70 family)
MPPPEDRPQVQAASPEEPSINILFRGMLAGDDQSARILFDAYQEMMLKVIRRRYLPVHSPLRRDLDTCDLLQEGWLSLLNAVHDDNKFQDWRDFRDFCLAVMSNRFKQYYRRRAAQKRSIAREASLAAGQEPAAAGRGPAEMAAENDQCSQLLARLSPD